MTLQGQNYSASQNNPGRRAPGRDQAENANQPAGTHTPQVDPRFFLLTIKRRIHHKRHAGKRLSTVEAYYARRPERIHGALRGPSLISVFGQIAITFLRPLPILAMLSLILVAEASTSALFTDDRREEKELRLAELLAMSPKTSEEWELQDSEDVVETADSGAQVSSPTTGAYPGLVEFITGVIAVYRPHETNAGQIARLIVEASHNYQIDPLYVASVIALESSFRPVARSKVGATGLMQVMPATAKEVAERHIGTRKRPQLTDPKTNIELGIVYLKYLEKRYRNRDLALRAYNWGPTNVDKSRQGSKRTPESVRGYSRKVMELTLRWNKHFERAAKNAAELNLAAGS